MLALITFVKVEANPVWFPINDKLRYVVVALHLTSDRSLKGKVKVNLKFSSRDRQPFVDSFANDLKGSKDVFLFYEGAIPWDESDLSGQVKLGKETYTFRSKVRGYGALKTSSLVLAYRISHNDPSALFKRDSLFIRPCFTCIFYGYLNFYLEALSDSSFIITGAITQGGEEVAIVPPKTFKHTGKLAVSLPIWDLKEGDYSLKVSIVSPTLGEEVTFNRPFIVSKYGDNIASFIDYIATEEELREFRRLTDLRERINFLRRFWQKRGDDFYREFRRRVVYADSAFSTPNRLGRYTDMGRIYIKRGKPDEITQVDLSEGSRPYIKWVYYTGGGYTYYFYDPIGTGEYVLVKTDDPEEPTFRSRNVMPSLDFDEGGGWDE